MRRHLLALLAFAAALFALSERPSLANPDPTAPASAAAAATATASAAAAGAAPDAAAQATDAGASDAGPPPPPFDAEPLPAERSPAPKPDEWHAATPLSLTRNFTPCRAYRVREWMKVDCTHLSPAGLAQIAGPSEGVLLFIASPSHIHENGPDDPGRITEPRTMEVVFPLHRGAGHMFQFLELGDGYNGPESAEVSLILADSWVDGEAPVITLH